MGGACNTLIHPRCNNSNLSFGVDEYGFTGFPGGIRSIIGNFYNFGIQGYWWTTTEYSSEAAWMIELFYGDTAIYEEAFGVRNAYSIRCLRD